MKSEEMIDLFQRIKPKLHWQIGRDGAIQALKQQRDDAGIYLCLPGATATKPMTYLGHPIELVAGNEVKLIARIGNVDIICPELVRFI